MMCEMIPRLEHPRPDFMRDTFYNLNGQWAFADAILEVPYIQGYCYTQLTDIQQEVNGLLTPDRKPKMDVERVRSINRNPDWHTERDLIDAVPTAWE